MDYYVKQFNLSWFEPWLVEAVVIMGLGMILAMILTVAARWMNDRD